MQAMAPRCGYFSEMSFHLSEIIFFEFNLSYKENFEEVTRLVARLTRFFYGSHGPTLRIFFKDEFTPFRDDIL